jgi:hypothetical protein
MTESSNFTGTPGGSPGRPQALNPEIRYLSIAKVNEDRALLGLPSSTTKKAYAEEVRFGKIN